MNSDKIKSNQIKVRLTNGDETVASPRHSHPVRAGGKHDFKAFQIVESLLETPSQVVKRLFNDECVVIQSCCGGSESVVVRRKDHLGFESRENLSGEDAVDERQRNVAQNGPEATAFIIGIGIDGCTPLLMDQIQVAQDSVD